MAKTTTRIATILSERVGSAATFEARDEARRLLDGAFNEWARLAEAAYDTECEGHPAGPDDAMGVTTYCDGSCRKGVTA